MNDKGNVRSLGIRCNHKIREYSCYIIRRFSACKLAHARTFISAGRLLHSIGHDCICKVSGADREYCMADTIASDTGIWRQATGGFIITSVFSLPIG